MVTSSYVFSDNFVPFSFASTIAFDGTFLFNDPVGSGNLSFENELNFSCFLIN